ncbi:MAG: contact-dependent growth inhibition system immunity protein [Chitinophagaceae bacterium]|jgi:hypothetical protein
MSQGLNNKNSSLEVLEGDYWAVPDFNSHLVKKCHELRKVPLSEFSIEDFRLMISQQTGLKFLVPLVLDILSGDFFAEGDFYEGDLLVAVLKIDLNFWILNNDLKEKLAVLIATNKSEIIERGIDLKNFSEI